MKKLNWAMLIGVMALQFIWVQDRAIGADYIFSTPGQKVIYQGKFEKNGQVVPFTKRLDVIDPGMVQGADFDVIQNAVILSDNFSDQKVFFYRIAEDGIYLVATAPNVGGAITVLKDPSKEIPLPLKVGEKWKKSRMEGHSQVTMDLEVVSDSEVLKLDSGEEKVFKIKATGSMIHNGKSTKIEREIYISKSGRVKQVTTKYMPDGGKVVDSIVVKKITQPEKNKKATSKEESAKSTENVNSGEKRK